MCGAWVAAGKLVFGNFGDSGIISTIRACSVCKGTVQGHDIYMR